MASATRINDYDVPEERARDVTLREWIRDHDNQLHVHDKRDSELAAQIDELRMRIANIERSIGD